MVLRLVLGGVYAAMAVGQLASFDEMPGILGAYRLVSGVAATALAVVLIAGELVCGVWFVARPRSKALIPVWVYTGVSLIWSALAVQAYARGLTVANCGCFGVYLSQRLSGFVLVQDALTLVYAVLLLPAAHRSRPAGRRHQRAEPRRLHRSREAMTVDDTEQAPSAAKDVGAPTEKGVDAPQKRDRDEVFVEFTKSICPMCKTPVDAQVNIRAGKVYLRKRCKEHGQFEALVYGDAEEYLASSRFNKPGTIPLVFQTEVKDGCPSDCGLCPEHKQHACLGIIEVNTGCNLDCPICFADSGHQSDGYAITHEQCERMLDAFVESEGEAEVVMFSGGEPTIHKHILDFIDLAQARPIRNINLNTNGIRLASDKRFVAELGNRNQMPGRSVNVYLQFDGFEERTHREIRGRDLRTFKQRALDNCAEEGLTVTLVAAVERGLNEHELGAIIEFGIDHPAVRSVAFQPVTHSGRHVEFNPLHRLTNPDIINLISAQRPQWFQKGDFFPVPCCFPTCRSITYLLVDGEPGSRTVVPIPRLLQVDDYLDYVTNRVMPDAGIREALEKLWSASAFMGTETTEEKLRATAEALDCADSCGIDLPQTVKDLNEKAFMIVVQDFQDPYTLNVKQLMKCCVEEITPDGRLIPFCAYNSVGYREQVRAQMSGVPVAQVVPNALPLADRLADTPYGSKTARTSGEGDSRP